MKWFKKKNKSSPRQPQPDKPNQKVFSYYTASKNQLNNFDRQAQAIRSETIQKNRINRLLSNWFFIFAALILLLVAGYILSLTRQATVDISGPKYRSNQEYQQIVNDILAQDIKNYTKPTLNSNSIKKSIATKIPEANEVTVKTDILGHRPIIIIKTDKALAVFNNPNSESFILSDRGRLLLPASEANVETTKLPVIDNQTGVYGKSGDQFLSPEEALNFAKLLSQSEATGLIRFILPSNPREIYLAPTQSRGYQVRYLLNNDIALQHGAYKAAIKKLAELGNVPANYIDVRLVEKVYFK